MSKAIILAARRTAVAPRGGAFRHLEAHELAAPVIREVLADAEIQPDEIDEVILGNALYGGGNPARLAALAAKLPESVSALTVDTQCCAGLDAILLAASRIMAGEVDAILAGGVESFSRSPLRFVRPNGDEPPREYQRPPFTPFADRDPDMIEAAAALAAELGISREAQDAFAVESHRRALDGAAEGEIVEFAKLKRDAFARALDPRACARLPVLAGDAQHGVTAATVAVEADAAAVVLVVSESFAARLPATRRLTIIGGARRGGDPTRPGLAPIAAGQELLERHGVSPAQLARAEIMEAFAVQAIACMRGLGLDPDIVNRGGGALSRGHPIGASGAVLAVRLFHELASAPAGATGLAAIAAAGGLGSAMLVG